MFIIKLVLDNIPLELLNDNAFVVIKNALEEYTRKGSIDKTNALTYLAVSNELFSSIDFSAVDEELKDYIHIAEPGTICELRFNIQEFYISFIIRTYEDTYHVDFEVTDKKKHETINIGYDKMDNEVYMDITREKWDLEYYLDYSYDVKSFIDGKPVVTEDDERMKDENFIEKFKVPAHLVREYRKNFKKYAKEINAWRSIRLQEETDEDLNKEDLDFQLFDSINHFIEYGKHYAMYKDRLMQYKQSLESITPKIDGPFALSVNVIDNIQSHLLGLINVLRTKGILITECESGYKMFYIVLQDTSLVMMAMDEPEDKIKEVFERAEYNISEADQTEEIIRKELEDNGIDPDTGRKL